MDDPIPSKDVPVSSFVRLSLQLNTRKYVQRDLLESIHRGYRILDLITERGSGGLGMFGSTFFTVIDTLQSRKSL